MAAEGPADLLLVEDDDAVGTTMVRGLAAHGFRVRWVPTAQRALDSLQEQTPAAVVIDLGLPDLDGLELCRRMRSRYGGPLLVVTARDAEDDRVLGLDVGADDYVVKPVGLRELAARIRAVQRRGTHNGQRTSMRCGTLTVDASAHEVVLDGQHVDVTPTEFDVLVALATADGAVVDREALVKAVWGHVWRGGNKTLDVHVASLRRKLGDPQWIRAVRGVGLRLAPPGDA